MPDGDVTLGEVSRALLALEERINQRLDREFAQMNRRLDTLQYVPRGEYDLQVASMRENIRELEDSKKWLVRTMVGAFLFPLLVAIVVALIVVQR